MKYSTAPAAGADTGGAMNALAATGEDAAWAAVVVPQATAEVEGFLRDPEHLFRLNPYLDIASWMPAPGPGRRFRVDALNEMTGRRREVLITLAPLEAGCGYVLTYERGLKRATELRIEATDGGTRVTLRDEYPAVDPADTERLREVDRSLIPWAAGIHAWFTGLHRWGRWPGYRGYRRFWLTLAPRQRRIARLLIGSTVAEFAVFLAAVAVL